MKITIDFPSALIDIDRKITISGAPANAEVVVSTQTERSGQIWRSEQRLQCDENGELQCGMELIYHQRAEHAAATELFEPSVYHPVHTQLFAQSEGRSSDTAKPTVLTQQLTHDTVQRVEVNEQGLKGVLFVPAVAGATPAVLVLKSQASEGLDEAQAALYAARGYAAFAIDYNEAEQGSVAYFSTALAWLREKIRPKHHFVAVSGYGQGAELALQLGAELADQVSAVMACEPTAVALPEAAMLDKLDCPLLLASGQAHSSQAYQQAIAHYFEQHGFNYHFEWYSFEGVAAGLRFAHLPTTLSTSDNAQVEALAQANKTLWFGIIGFLHQAVAKAAPGGAVGQSIQ